MGRDAALVPPDLIPVALLRLTADRRLVEQVEWALSGPSRRCSSDTAGGCSTLEASCSAPARTPRTSCSRRSWSPRRRSRESPRALRPWLYGIARHRCLTLLRARRMRSVPDAPELAIDHVAAEVITRDELRALLRDLARLPGDQRPALRPRRARRRLPRGDRSVSRLLAREARKSSPS